MINLISKQSSQIEFPVPTKTIHGIQSRANAVIIESGVAVISFGGQSATDWTRDNLSFPVGKITPQADFVSGIASGSPASFWTDSPPLNLGIYQFSEPVSLQVRVTGSNSAGPVVSTGVVTGSFPEIGEEPTVKIPDIGCAVDSATVAYSSEAGQTVATFALAVFGVTTFFLRVSYTVHILLGAPGIAVVGNGDGEHANAI